MGLIREMVIAGVAGADTAVDAYRVAFIVPEILNHILASGFLSVTFIPIFSRYLVEKRDGEGWRVFSLILTVFGAFLLVLIVVAEIYSTLLDRSAGAGSHRSGFSRDGRAHDPYHSARPVLLFCRWFADGRSIRPRAVFYPGPGPAGL